jgi:hypothetical protein
MFIYCYNLGLLLSLQCGGGCRSQYKSAFKMLGEDGASPAGVESCFVVLFFYFFFVDNFGLLTD